MIKPMLAAMALAGIVVAPVSAQTQAIDWNAAKAAYDAGFNAPQGVTTRGDKIACAAFWSEWSRRAQAGQIPEEAGTVIGLGLTDPHAGLTATAMHVALAVPEPGADPAQMAAFTRDALALMERAADEKVEVALRGDMTALTGILGLMGICAKP